jgi:hypothetical protein
MNYPIELSLGTSFGKSGEWREKLRVFVFPEFTVPICSATLNIPVSNTARYAPIKLKVTIIFQSKTYNSDIWYIWLRKQFSRLSEKIWGIFTFYRLFSICNYKFWTIFLHSATWFPVWPWHVPWIWRVYMYLTRFTAKSQVNFEVRRGF